MLYRFFFLGDMVALLLSLFCFFTLSLFVGRGERGGEGEEGWGWEGIPLRPTWVARRENMTCCFLGSPVAFS